MAPDPTHLLVRLHRCKRCKARMFAIDRYGHMLRHGVPVTETDGLDSHFIVGTKDTPARVGGNYKALRRPRGQKKQIKDSE